MMNRSSLSIIPLTNIEFEELKTSRLEKSTALFDSKSLFKNSFTTASSLREILSLETFINP